MADSTPPSGLLYDGERRWEINGASAVSYYLAGSASNNLVAFIPGAYHNARIAYGGHGGSEPRDFLAFWLQQCGHSVLAISYPLESESNLLPPTRPDFTVSDWGAQAAEITSQIVRAHGLPIEVILVFWSMGAKILHSFTKEAKSRGLYVKVAVSLVGTPALRGIRERPHVVPTKTGYATSPASSRYFLASIQEQNSINGGRVIIPDDTYIRDYIGSTPVAMGAWGLKFDGRGFVEDKDVGYEAADEMGMTGLPFIGAISGDSPLDFRHTLTDKATWQFIMTHQLLRVVLGQNSFVRLPSPSFQVGREGCDADKTGEDSAQDRAGVHDSTARSTWLLEHPDRAREVIRLVHTLSEKMSASVQGNHHFFVGERGAKATAELIVQFQQHIDIFTRNLSMIFSPSP